MPPTPKPDYQAVLELVTPRATVLDLGCGSGELLELLTREKQIKGQGVEIDDKAIFACVGKGLNVLHGDIDSGLTDYGDGSFDFVILNQSLQQVIHVEKILGDAMRVGKKVIVGFPNFAHIGARLQIFFQGRAPVTPSLPFRWHTTPNLHFLSIRDFTEFCRERRIPIEREIYLGKSGRVSFLPNLFAETAVFQISSPRP